jgi:eukaryotic-like serine/threonine-protein kinase
VADARRQLRSLGLTVTVVQVRSDEPAGTVVRQSPRAGAELRKGATVRLAVSTGPRTVDVPDVTGLDEGSARSELEGAGFEVRVVDQETTDPTEDGVVLTQEPAGGTAASGSVVTLTVGRLA